MQTGKNLHWCAQYPKNTIRRRFSHKPRRNLKKRLRVNRWIRIPRVQVIDEHGENLGEMETYRALQLAQERGLDLVEVAPNKRPSIARIMDYGKYKYQKEKQEKESKKQSKEKEEKTIRIRFKTGKHDMEIKAKKIDEFLKDKAPVKIEMRLRGREHKLKDIARQQLELFLSFIKEPFDTEGTKTIPHGWIVSIKPGRP